MKRIIMTDELIYRLSGLDKVKRLKMSRYYGRLTECERIEAFRLAYDLARQNMAKADEHIRAKPDFFYAMLCLAIWKMQWSREVFSKKNKNLSMAEAGKITKRRLESVHFARGDRVRRGRLKNILDLRLYHVIQALRSSGLSWRECSVYLKKYHKLTVSHVYLRKVFMNISAEKEHRGEK